jgi:transcriptional/translational regulatory protein YebC/TACO1
MGAGGTARWAFEKKGIIAIAKADATEDQLMEIAVGGGADDYQDLGEEWQVTCEGGVLDPVSKALEDAKIKVKAYSQGFIPKTKKVLAGRDAEVAMNLVEALDAHDDVPNVYADFDVSEEDLARMAEG